ncbi:MAG TPA: cyclic-di-AMP receptor [Thermomicrobiales bacterium]|nr:cyclic-di-AMP receptor [Thermomicrobiales bacterium]
MKLIIAVVQDYDGDRLLKAVTAAGFGATKISSAGGFLRMGNCTVLMGVEDQRAAACLRIVRQACRARPEIEPDQVSPDVHEWCPSGVDEVMVGGGVAFQLAVEAFYRLEAAGTPELATRRR